LPDSGSASAWCAAAPARYNPVMRHALTGVLHGRTIELVEADVAFEGLRVRVILEKLIEDEPVPSKAENARLLNEWATLGPQGPVDEDKRLPDMIARGDIRWFG
jgi:hypothetical protein